MSMNETMISSDRRKGMGRKDGTIKRLVILNNKNFGELGEEDDYLW